MTNIGQPFAHHTKEVGMSKKKKNNSEGSARAAKIKKIKKTPLNTTGGTYSTPLHSENEVSRTGGGGNYFFGILFFLRMPTSSDAPMAL